ncbi:MAG: DUF4349 domain-containing protein [Oscillospiraceae bacterium]|nr:DUF4349 domain-containing protein [Oscillospiraceae bacterium]
MKKKIVTLIAILMVVVLYAGCASNYDSNSYSASADMVSYPSSASTASGSGANTASSEMLMKREYEAADEALYDNDGGLGGVSPVNQTPDKGLKIIYTANMNIQTIEWEDNYPLLLNLIDEFDGYIQNSSVSGGYTSQSGYYNARSAYLSIRIPSANYRDFLNSADSKLSTITSLNEYTDDITAQYVDTQARITTLKAQEQRLLALLENAGDLSDLLEIELKLGDVRYQIESYQSIMNTYNNLLSYSTINIDVHEVSTVVILKDTFGQRVLAAIDDSLKAVLSFLDGLVIVLIYLAPYMIIALIVIVIVRLLTKKRRLARKERKAGAKQQPQPVGYTIPSQQYTSNEYVAPVSNPSISDNQDVT